MKDLTLSQIKELKGKLDTEIGNLIADFENKTGLDIKEVVLMREDLGYGGSCVIRINTNVKLELN